MVLFRFFYNDQININKLLESYAFRQVFDYLKSIFVPANLKSKLSFGSNLHKSNFRNRLYPPDLGLISALGKDSVFWVVDFIISNIPSLVVNPIIIFNPLQESTKDNIQWL